LQINPRNPIALSARGLAWMRKKDFSRALADLDRSLKLDASNIESYYLRAGIHEGQGNRERAIADLRKVTEMNPNTVFDAVVQVEAKKRIEQFNKRIPCGNIGGAGETCL
jgi:tetratricopeptide (TPR) repeat protein